MSQLTFDALRKANAARVGLFKNGRGNLAHRASDGSDWTVAQWFQAMVGEIGEFAEVRNAFEAGAISWEAYAVKAANELPDSLIYHDLLCMRALDSTERRDRPDAAQLLMQAMEHIGIYANARKKFDRGDLSEGALRLTAENELKDAIECMTRLIVGAHASENASTATIHRFGIHLGEVVTEKFNAVSDRVDTPIYLSDDGRACQSIDPTGLDKRAHLRPL